MLEKINDDQIVAFRALVNGCDQFVLRTYSEREGKNQWNLICSSMDWISVAIRNLQNFPELDSNIDVRVMQVYSLISSVDIVHEAITQLHRVFFDQRSSTVPFKGDRDIFAQRAFDRDDNEYFKEIRSCFGAHPVNLMGEGKERRFASWPYEGGLQGGSDFQVRLYSNDPSIDDITFGLNVSEIFAFLRSRYAYLGNISSQIVKLYGQSRQELASKPIERDENILQNVYTLLAENDLRFGNDYYKNTLDELKLLLETKLIEAALFEEEAEFKRALEPLVDEIWKNLQEMHIVDLNRTELLNPVSGKVSLLHYELPKFYSCVLSNRRYDDPLFDFYLERINEVSGGKYSLKTSDSDGQLLLKLKLMLANK